MTAAMRPRQYRATKAELRAGDRRANRRRKEGSRPISISFSASSMILGSAEISSAMPSI